MEWYLYVAVVAAGFGAGFINTLAGSGSLITLPLLMFIGLPPTVANGTNRVAVLLQTVVAVSRFHKDKQIDFRRAFMLAIPAIVGAILGAQIAANLNETVMRQVIGGLMVVMLVVVLIRPKRWLEGRPEMMVRPPGWLQIVVFFAIGVYGGFIQAGVGVFLLAGLVLGAGYDLVKANAVKNLLVMCFTVFALIVFVINNQVIWEIGLIMALGSMAGAWVAARMAVKRGAVFVRWILIAVIVVSAVTFLGVKDLVFNLF